MMRLAKAVALAAFALALAVPSAAREKRVKIDDLPAAVKQAVLDVSRGLKIRELTQEEEKGQTFYEAELDVNGRTRDVIIDTSGTVVLIEEEVDWNMVPEAARAAIEKAAQGRKILFVETLTRNNKVEAYEAHVERRWWRDLEIKVDPEGQPIDPK